MSKATAPLYKFTVEIRKSKGYTPASIFNDIIDKTKTQFYAVLKGKNGEIVFAGETRTRKSGLIKTMNNLFPGVVITDTTK